MLGKRAEEQHVSKKIWLTLHPRNFGSVKIVRTSTRSCKLGLKFRISETRVLAVNCMATRFFREKKQQLSRVLSST